MSETIGTGAFRAVIPDNATHIMTWYRGREVAFEVWVAGVGTLQTELICFGSRLGEGRKRKIGRELTHVIVADRRRGGEPRRFDLPIDPKTIRELARDV